MKETIQTAAESFLPALWAMSRAMYDHPELGLEEVNSSRMLREWLAEQGFKVEENFHGLPTAFRAVYGSGRPVLGFLCEYDALPEVGHGCGHDLIGVVSAGAAAVLRQTVDAVGGTLIVYGTPDEEVTCTKVQLTDEGAFDELDVALMLLKNSITEDKTIWAGLNHPELPLEEADIAVFGIPYDGGVSFRSGTCEAPQELRKITHTISPTTEDFRDISSVKVKDLGDCVGKDRDEMFAEAEELAYQAVKAGKFFTMIGGDHSVTIPVHRGVNRAVEEDFGIIHIDAHFDLCHEMHGDILSHGSTERRATELSHVGDSDHLYFLGIRSIESDELEFYQNNKINVLSAADVDHLGVPAALERMVSHMKRFSKVYITLDIDCLDPAYAAGTGTPQFGGLTARQLLDLLKGLFDGLNIIGMDVVEVAPRLDPSLAALFAARKIITECWAHHYFKNLARA